MIPKAVITGAYGAIGQAIARGIAREGFEIMLVGRNKAKLEQAKTDILNRYPKTAIGYAVVDLSRAKEIQKLAATSESEWNVLVNNACTAPGTRVETPEGIEMQWATNVLGYFWMIRHFAPLMKNLPDARIVNVASYWAGGLDMNDPEFRNRTYDNDQAYRQSKQADRMLTAYFARELSPLGITVNACHPGDVNSKLSNDLGYGGSESPEQGADTPVWLSTSPELKGKTGHYYEHRRKQPCSFMNDTRGIEQLIRICSAYVTISSSDSMIPSE